MLRYRVYLCALLAACSLAGSAIAGAGTALASKSQSTFFQAPHELLDPSTRTQALNQLAELGVNAVRVEIEWSALAPKPEARFAPRFAARNPSSYAWGNYEGLIDAVHARGWKLLLTVSGPAPRWATGNKQAPYVTRPNDKAFEEFMTAVGKKFRAQVSDFAIWNEPNEYGQLRPQFGGKGQPIAGRLYRNLFLAGYRGLRAAGLGKPTMLMGETSPGGFLQAPKHLSYAGMAPLTFLRNTLCLNASYQREKGCKGSLPASGYSQHPYALDGEGPYDKPKQTEDVTIATIGRLVSALNRAAKAGAIRGGLPIFLTEYGVMSRPNKGPFAVSVEKQAAYDAIAEHVAWANGRVAAFSQYLLEDDPTYRGKYEVSFQTGLEYSSGGKKPLYYSFPVPMTVTPVRGHGYNLWGFVRPAHKATKVTILIQRPKARSFSVLKTVRTGRGGYWTFKSNVKGSYWKVRWISPSGKKYEGTRIGAYPLP
ncbi:MAG: cellulase family glycosylhydrolase [Solirubrobacteraceae bacterium]